MTFNNRFRRVVVMGVLAAVMGGPVVAFAERMAQISRVQAYDTDFWTMRVPAGREVTVIVDGDGDTDLDCRARTSYGTALASDLDTTDYCILRFTTAYPDTIEVEIENLGSVWNEYEISIRY